MLRRELPISNCSRSGSGAAAGIIAGIAITADKPQRQRKRPVQAGLFVLPSFRGAQSANPESRDEWVLFWVRHSGAIQSIEPGISRFPDVQAHI
jgi:hypothetical protein